MWHRSCISRARQGRVGLTYIKAESVRGETQSPSSSSSGEGAARSSAGVWSHPGAAEPVPCGFLGCPRWVGAGRRVPGAVRGRTFPCRSQRRGMESAGGMGLFAPALSAPLCSQLQGCSRQGIPGMLQGCSRDAPGRDFQGCSSAAPKSRLCPPASLPRVG